MSATPTQDSTTTTVEELPSGVVRLDMGAALLGRGLIINMEVIEPQPKRNTEPIGFYLNQGAKIPPGAMRLRDMLPKPAVVVEHI